MVFSLCRSNYKLVTFDEGKNIIEKGDADIMLSPYIIESADLDSYDISMPITTSWYVNLQIVSILIEYSNFNYLS